MAFVFAFTEPAQASRVGDHRGVVGAKNRWRHHKIDIMILRDILQRRAQRAVGRNAATQAQRLNRFVNRVAVRVLDNGARHVLRQLRNRGALKTRGDISDDCALKFGMFFRGLCARGFKS